ncbi:Serine protease [Corynebacterium choanae]|uniref:Serine protease n=1 Tax=Corynebacterium choanae TaxID=1862358 RepID=A0A3G6J913_9CORY|nr:Serine protease [Corynebacterium choanae]
MDLLQAVGAVDVLLGCVLLIAVGFGWRQGAIATLIDGLAVILGFVAALQIAPYVMAMVQTALLRWLIALSLLLFFTGIASVLGTAVSNRVRARMKHHSTMRQDKFVGMLVSPVVALVFSYLLLAPVASIAGGTIAGELRQSRLLFGVNQLIPDSVHTVDDQFAGLLADSLLQPPSDPFAVTAPDKLPPVADLSVDNDLVAAVRPAVVQVLAVADRCTHGMRGTGFVIADDLIVTNAHVVAGTNQVAVDTVTGTKPATVVLYDPDEDIAVLRSDNLGLPALDWAAAMPMFAETVTIVGYPDGGPFTAVPARIVSLRVTSGVDIYGETANVRAIYRIDGDVRRGNSGGPMINAAGEVLGVVFADEIHHAQEGFVLAGTEVQELLGDVSTYRLPVDTGRCVGE